MGEFLLPLIVAPEGDVISRWQAKFLYMILYIRDDAANVSMGDIAGDLNPPLQVFPLDAQRTCISPNLTDGR